MTGGCFALKFGLPILYDKDGNMTGKGNERFRVSGSKVDIYEHNKHIKIVTFDQ
jgi:hypothetical protein